MQNVLHDVSDRLSHFTGKLWRKLENFHRPVRGGYYTARKLWCHLWRICFVYICLSKSLSDLVWYVGLRSEFGVASTFCVLIRSWSKLLVSSLRLWSQWKIKWPILWRLSMLVFFKDGIRFLWQHCQSIESSCVVLRLTSHKVRHIGDVSPSQSAIPCTLLCRYTSWLLWSCFRWMVGLWAQISCMLVCQRQRLFCLCYLWLQQAQFSLIIS